MTRRSRVASVLLSGGFGCGKTTLILQTLAALTPAIRVGVIAAQGDPSRDGEPYSSFTNQVSHFVSGNARLLSAANLQSALSNLQLNDLDLLLIENASFWDIPNDYDVGQDVRVLIYSIAAGDHKAAKYPESVRWADAVVINKLDLLTQSSFDVEKFCKDLRQLNLGIKIFIVSAISGAGMDEWIAWLRQQLRAPKVHPARIHYGRAHE